MSIKPVRPASEARRGPGLGLAGSLALLGAWQAAVELGHVGSGTIPAPLGILRQMAADGPTLYLSNAANTLRSATFGWLWGNGLGIALGVLAAIVPALGRLVLGLGVVSFCLPVVAIGPVLAIVFSGDVPRVVLSALCVFFTTLVATMIGLRSADQAAIDLVHAFGGRPIDQLVKVRLKAALPSLFAGLRVAAPAAILGSIVGELLGAENGLGVLLINSQQALNFARTWGVILVATLVAGCGYALTSLVARLATPWAREISANLATGLGASPRASTRATVLGVALSVAETLVFVALGLLAWWALLKLSGVSPFIGKGPLDVWAYLTDPLTGVDNRAALRAEALISLRDGTTGLAAGTAAAVLAAAAFTVWPALQRIFIGPSMALQSMPLIAITPVIVLIFGRSLMGIAVIGGIIAFFPTLVNVSLALARTPQQTLDLAQVYGGSRWAILRKIRVPIALPSLFASLRVAAPLAMTGAMLAEWLATGQGLGYAILQATSTSDYDGLWTRVVLVTAFSLTLYWLIGLAERLVLAHVAPVNG